MTSDEREQVIADAIRFLAGDTDEDAENAYFGILESHDPDTAWSLIDEIATRSKGIADPQDIGAGLLESFIIRYGAQRPELIADGIIGNARLIAALPIVRSIHSFPKLKALLPVGLA